MEVLAPHNIGMDGTLELQESLFLNSEEASVRHSYG